MAENSPYTRVSLDIGTEPALRARQQILDVLPQIDVIFPNETELTLLGEGRTADDSLDYLLDGKVGSVVTKCGADGCILALSNKRVHLPAFKINAKDTTGAGDSFNAGVVFGRLVGLSWEASAALGNALGGWATGQEGAGAHAINRAVVAKLVENHLFQPEWGSARYALEELAVYFEGPL